MARAAARLARLDGRPARLRRRARGEPAARRSRGRGRRGLAAAGVADARADRSRLGPRRPRGDARGAVARAPARPSSTRRSPPRCSRPRPGAIRFDALCAAEPSRPPRRLAAPARARRAGARAAAAAGQRGGADRSAAGAARGSSSRRSPSRAPGRRWRQRSATSPRSPTPPTRTRRGSTACSRPGRAARRDGEELSIAGLRRRPADRRRARVGSLERSAYRALLRRARVYLAAPAPRGVRDRPARGARRRRDARQQRDRGAATPRSGRRAPPTPRLIGRDLAGAIRTALDDPRPGYAAALAPLLEPFSPAQRRSRRRGAGAAALLSAALERRPQLRPRQRVADLLGAPSHARRAVQIAVAQHVEAAPASARRS